MLRGEIRERRFKHNGVISMNHYPQEELARIMNLNHAYLFSNKISRSSTGNLYLAESGHIALHCDSLERRTLKCCWLEQSPSFPGKAPKNLLSRILNRGWRRQRIVCIAEAVLGHLLRSKLALGCSISLFGVSVRYHHQNVGTALAVAPEASKP